MKNVPTASKMSSHGLDRTMLAGVTPALARKGWVIENQEDRSLFLSSIARHQPDAVLLVHDEIGCNAAKILSTIRSMNLFIPVVIIDREFSRDLAYEVINQGPVFIYPTLEGTDLNTMVERLSHFQRGDHGSAAHSLADLKMWDMMEGSTDWIWKLDPSDEISYSNEGSESLLGYGPSYLRGKKIWNLVPSILADKVQSDILRARKGRTTLHDLDLKILAKDGTLVQLTATITPLFAFDGRYIGSIGKCHDVTTRNLALERASAAEENQVLLLESIPDPVIVLDTNGFVKMINHRSVKFFGWEKEQDLVGKHAFSYVHEDDRGPALEDFKALLRGELPGAKVYRILRYDGSPMLVEVNSSITRNRSGAVESIILAYRDETEKVRTRTEMAEGRIRYQRLLEAVPDIVWEVDRDLCFTYVSQNVERISGFSIDEVLGMPMFETMDIDERARIADRLESSLTSQDQFKDVLINVKHKKGHQMVIEISGSPYYDELRTFQGYRGIAHDATERIKLERAKFEIEERQRMIAENLSDTIWTCDLDLRMTYASPRFNQRRGLPISEMLQDNMVRSMNPSSLQRMNDAISEMTRSEKLDDPLERAEHIVDVLINRPNGPPYWSEQRLCLMRGPEGKAVGLLGIGRDVTEIRRALETTQSSREMFLLLLDHVPDHVIVIDTSQEPFLIIEANQKACEELGYSKEELKLLPLTEVVMGFRPHQMKEWSTRLRKGEVVIIEGIHRRKNGSFYDVETRLSFVTLGDSPHVIAIARNVTELNEQMGLMKKRNRELVAMNRLIRTSAMARNKDELILSTMRLFDDMFEFELSSYLVSNDDGSMEPSQFHSERIDDWKAISSIMKERELIYQAFQRSEPSFYSNAGEISPIAKDLGIESLCLLPIHLDRCPMGVMVFMSLKRKDFSSSERELLTSAWCQLNDMIELLDHRGR